MALPETLPFTLGWITPTTAAITATPGTPTVTAPGTVSPSTATIVATLGAPDVTAADTVLPSPATIVATPGTPTVTAPDSVAPTAATITAAPGTPIVTAATTETPPSATITATPGTAGVNIATPPGGDLPWTLPFGLGGPNVITPGPAAITAIPGTPTVAGAPIQGPLPWKLPIILGGNRTLSLAGAQTTLVPGTAVISGTGFPYQFPFTFPANLLNIYPPTSATVTAQTGTPAITGGKPAVTPTGVAMYALPGTPTVTGPTRRTINPGYAIISVTSGTPVVHTVQSTTTVFICNGTHNLIDFNGGALITLPDNPLLTVVLPSLLNTKTVVLQTIDYPEAVFPMGNSMKIGRDRLAVAIQNCGGNFILAGYSQGAGICSEVLKEMQSGGLTAYLPQCVGAVMFGNICRQAGAIAPVQVDPGGHGAYSANLLTSTPTWWWEFANAFDVANTIPSSIFGDLICSILNVFLFDYLSPQANFFHWMLNNLDKGIALEARCLGDLVIFLASLLQLIPVPAGMPNLNPHGTYHLVAPPGATLTSAQLAANYINDLTRNGTVRTYRTIEPGGTTIIATAGLPEASALISPATATTVATMGTAVVTAPVLLSPTGDTITTHLGTPNENPLPWTLPVTL